MHKMRELALLFIIAFSSFGGCLIGIGETGAGVALIVMACFMSAIARKAVI